LVSFGWPSVRKKKALLDVHAHSGNQHHADDDGHRGWREKSQRERQSTAALSQSRQQRVTPAWWESQHREELTGPI